MDLYSNSLEERELSYVALKLYHHFTRNRGSLKRSFFNTNSPL